MLAIIECRKRLCNYEQRTDEGLLNCIEKVQTNWKDNCNIDPEYGVSPRPGLVSSIVKNFEEKISENNVELKFDLNSDVLNRKITKWTNACILCALLIHNTDETRWNTIGLKNNYIKGVNNCHLQSLKPSHLC